MDDKDSESRTEMSHSRSRRKFLYAVGGAGIVSAAGLASMGAQAECHQDRPQEEPDGEPDRGSAQVLRGVVRQYRGRRAGRIFHRRRRLPQYPAGARTGREAIANNIARSSALARQASRASSSASSTSQPMVRS